MKTEKVLRLVITAVRCMSMALLVSGLVIMFCATGNDLPTKDVVIYGITGLVLVLQYTFLSDRLPAWIEQTVYRRAARKRAQERIQKELEERNSEALDPSWIKL